MLHSFSRAVFEEAARAPHPTLWFLLSGRASRCMQQQGCPVPQGNAMLRWEWACHNYLHWVTERRDYTAILRSNWGLVWSVGTIMYRKQQWERKKEEVREPETCWLWRGMKNRKPENEEEWVGEPVYLTLETWGISRHCIQRVMGIKNLTLKKISIWGHISTLLE